jgi:hypothetical protein
MNTMQKIRRVCTIGMMPVGIAVPEREQEHHEKHHSTRDGLLGVALLVAMAAAATLGCRPEVGPRPVDVFSVTPAFAKPGELVNLSISKPDQMWNITSHLERDISFHCPCKRTPLL